MNDLLKLRAAKRKEQIGFESQQRAEREKERHEMKKERHQWTSSSPKPRSMANNSRSEPRYQRFERLRVFTKSMNAIGASSRP